MCYEYFEMLTRLIKIYIYKENCGNSGEIIDATTSLDKMNLMIALRQFTAHSLPRALGLKTKTDTTIFLMMHLGERKLSLLRKKDFYKRVDQHLIEHLT